MQYKLSAFADEISDNFETQLKVLKSFNIGYIEARCIENVQLIEYSTKDIKEFKNILDGYGIKLSSLASPIGKISIRGDLKTHYEKFKRTVEIAEILEAPYIRMFSYYIDRDTIPGKFKGKVLDELNKYAEYMKNHNIVLLHENEKHIFGDTLERCLFIFKNIKSDKLKAAFDFSNFIQCNEKDIYEAYGKLKPYIEYFHIKDAILEDGIVVPAGQGDGNISAILKDAYKDGFDGFLSIEPHLNKSLPGGGEKTFEVAYKALADILSKIEGEK
jgi:sugar phosphate isomerase/epimerase